MLPMLLSMLCCILYAMTLSWKSYPSMMIYSELLCKSGMLMMKIQIFFCARLNFMSFNTKMQRFILNFKNVTETLGWNSIYRKLSYCILVSNNNIRTIPYLMKDETKMNILFLKIWEWEWFLICFKCASPATRHKWMA